MLRGLRTVIYHVAELEAATAWYRAVLGFGPYFEQPFYVGFDVGGYELGLQPAEARVGPGGDTVYWGVDDVSSEVQRLVGLGATVRDAPQNVGGAIVVATVLDPFGNALGLIRNPEFAPPLTFAGVGELSERSIVRTVEDSARTAEAAFAMWSSSAGLASWWAQESRVELRPGGHYELYFAAADEVPVGQRGGEGCRVLSFVPGRMLSFTWNAPPELPITRGLPTFVVLEFEPRADRCRVTLRHLGWPQAAWALEPQWAETYAYFEDAWSRVFELLARF